MRFTYFTVLWRALSLWGCSSQLSSHPYCFSACQCSHLQRGVNDSFPPTFFATISHIFNKTVNFRRDSVAGRIQITIFLENVKGPEQVGNAVEVVWFCDKLTTYLFPPEIVWVSICWNIAWIRTWTFESQLCSLETLPWEL